MLDGLKPLFANDRACALLGTDPMAVVSDGLGPLVSTGDRIVLEEALRRRGRAPGRETVGFRRADGDPRRFEVVLTSQRNADVLQGGESDALLVIALVEDVTHEVEAQEALERRATRDDLTGLRNRAWLLDHLHASLSAGLAVTVTYLDLSGFKAVNDEHGHRAGDRVLVAVAAGLSGEFGDGAVARVGGDEFVVVRSEVDAGSPSGTAAADARPGDGPWDLLERADADMYADKRSERRAG